MAILTTRLVDNASLWQMGREIGVTKLRYLNHPELVKEVCLECLHWHDTVWEIGDPGAPDPPLHPLCACTVEPEFEAGTELGSDPNGDPIIAEPPPALKPGEFLAGQVKKLPAAKMDKYLGPTKAKLVRIGILDPSNLVSASAGERKVEDILRSLKLTREELGDLSYEELRVLAERRLAKRRLRVARRRRVRPPTPEQRQAPYQIAGGDRSLSRFVPRIPTRT